MTHFLHSENFFSFLVIVVTNRHPLPEHDVLFEWCLKMLRKSERRRLQWSTNQNLKTHNSSFGSQQVSTADIRMYSNMVKHLSHVFSWSIRSNDRILPSASTFTQKLAKVFSEVFKHVKRTRSVMQTSIWSAFFIPLKAMMSVFFRFLRIIAKRFCPFSRPCPTFSWRDEKSLLVSLNFSSIVDWLKFLLDHLELFNIDTQDNLIEEDKFLRQMYLQCTNERQTKFNHFLIFFISFFGFNQNKITMMIFFLKKTQLLARICHKSNSTWRENWN